MRISLTVKSDNLVNALRAHPRLLARNLGGAIRYGGELVARDAKRRAPKAFSTLTQSIKSTPVSAYEAIVSAGVNYAAAVEQGTRPGSLPPVDNIYDWVRVRRLQPQNEAYDQRDLAWFIAAGIEQHGTRPQPFMQPALNSNKARIERRINAAIDAALAGRST